MHWLYFCDKKNNRIIRFNKSLGECDIIFQGTSKNNIHYPYGFLFDKEKNLLITDTKNDRILK